MKIIKLFKETNEIQRVVTLRNSRNNRYRYREFILEGRVAIDQAYAKGWKVKTLFYQKDLLSTWALERLRQVQDETLYEITSSLMDKIADKAENNGLIAIAEMQIRPFSAYQPFSSRPEVIVVLDEPKSAGNVGMMIRSAVCFGASALVISGHAADEYDPKCIRASVGTFFSIPIYRVEGGSKFFQKVEEFRAQRNISILASGDRGALPLEKIKIESDLLFIILGNETEGISVSYREGANQFVRISLPGKFTSLNVAAAGSIFLYEIFRQLKGNI